MSDNVKVREIIAAISRLTNGGETIADTGERAWFMRCLNIHECITKLQYANELMLAKEFAKMLPQPETLQSWAKLYVPGWEE